MRKVRNISGLVSARNLPWSPHPLYGFNYNLEMQV